MSTVSGRGWRRLIGVALVSAASGVAGWTLGAHADVRLASVLPTPEVARPAPATWSLTDGGEPGHVSPEAGVLVNDTTVMVSDSACQLADEELDFVDAERLAQTLVEGTPNEGHKALTQALENGIELPPEVLQQAYLSNPSEEVRLLAFATYVDAVSDDRVQVRAVLESGIYNDSSAVRAEALRRLEELERYERMLAEAQTLGLP